MKYIQVYALILLLVFCTSCGGQGKPNLSKEKSRPESKEINTFPGPNETYHTRYTYSDSIGKSLIIQNSFPKGEKYIGPAGEEYFKTIFWTRIFNGTDKSFELAINFSGDSYEFPTSVGSSINNYRNIILPSNTMTRDKEHMFNYGLTDLDSFLANNMHKPSSLKGTIDPKESVGFYVVMLLIKPKSGWQSIQDDGNHSTRAGFSLKRQTLFYTVNGKEILCGKINLKNLILKK